MASVLEVSAPRKGLDSLIDELYGPSETGHPVVPCLSSPLSPAFREALRVEVAILQAKHPVLVHALGRAQALLIDGRLFPEEDGHSAMVLRSDGTGWYHVNGSCPCPTSQYREEPCKHRTALRLYQRVSATLDETPTLEPGASAAAENMALPEAPASVNVRVTIAGRDVQVTLRDSNEARLLLRLESLLARYPVDAPAIPAVPQEGWCGVHSIQMRHNTRAGQSWWSHKLQDGSWCKGK